MKIFTYIVMALALGLLIFNTTKLDFDGLFEGDSAVAVIGILAAACVILLMVILRISHKIKDKQK
ncbi:MAG: hypothetical protein AAFP76_14440 [Bacteroidota bacterium]